jgi:hypothetical protein
MTNRRGVLEDLPLYFEMQGLKTVSFMIGGAEGGGATSRRTKTSPTVVWDVLN